MPDPTKLEINRLYSRNKPIKRTVVKPTDNEDEVEEVEEEYVKDPKTGKLIKVSEDTTIKKTSASFKRTIGDTAAQMKRAEELGLKSASDELKRRMEEKKKQMKK